MISSMTGFGRAEKTENDIKLTVEVSSVNNRFLEFQIRLPKNLAELEPRIKRLLSARLNRGKIYLNLTYDNDNSGDGPLRLDMKKADFYYSFLKDLKTRYNLGGEITLDQFVNLPDLITVQTNQPDLDKTWEIIEPVCQQAIDNLCKMRQEEGDSLRVDFENRLNLIEKLLERIEERFTANYISYHEKFKKRIQELLAETPLDEQRLATEIALLADKLDITEETIRLKSHIQGFRQALDLEEAIGKKLTFILQEMHRETNTIGSKSADYDISALVINIKEELEKLREQSQNIE
ncbi:MAG: YicC family protein [candidate division Zixibacteria bacterium]|jgi:uncharacterized protein (TIGR00255 family)|nr:YicC family protein [candidate division Zixibacteria bacterium]